MQVLRPRKGEVDKMIRTRRSIALYQAEMIDNELRRQRELDKLVHPLDRRRPRPMTKEEFRARLMHDLGIEDDAP